MQQAELGENVAIAGDFEGLQRGDLVFWKGHVGIMIDSVMMVHANAHHMMVAVEPLPEAAQRIAKAGSQITAIKRMLLQGSQRASAGTAEIDARGAPRPLPARAFFAA